MVKNVSSDPAPGFPIFCFPPFIFSALPWSILRLLCFLWLSVGERLEARGYGLWVMGYRLSVIGLTPSFPIFYFPAFIFSPAALVDFAPSVLFVAERRLEARG